MSTIRQRAKLAKQAATNPSPADIGAPSSAVIHCTSKQSRFHAATIDTSREVDVEDITLSIGSSGNEKELISSSHLRLKEGVRYAFIGRNGSGKSTLLTALADKLIPGLSPTLRILLLSQVEDSTRARADETLLGRALTVLEHVVRGDKARQRALEDVTALNDAVESTSPVDTQRTVYTLKLKKRQQELVDARKVAERRSGTRGKEARGEEIKAEARVKEAEEGLASVGTSEPEPNIIPQALEMLAEAQAELDLYESDTTDARAATILAGLGFSQEMMDGPFASLSGGWRSRCSLATSLLVQSHILLLDEPSNFLDLEAIIWLEHFLVQPSERTLVLVSHDQDLLDNVCEETVALRNGALKYFEGNPSTMFVEEAKTRKHKVGVQEAMDKKKSHIEKSIQQGLSSAKQTGDDNRLRMVKSRQKKLDDRWGLEKSASGGRFKLNRDLEGYHLTARAGVNIEKLESEVKVRIHDPEPLRTTGDLLHFEGVSYAFPGAKQPLLEEVTFTLNQGGRIALVGANGQGKSTLAKLVMGEIKPTRGTITRHPLNKIGYFGQHSVENLTKLPLHSQSKTRDGPPAIATALTHFLDHFEALGEKLTEQEVRACLGSFGLQGKTAAETPLGLLSGGQKVRLALALIVYNPPPMLLLDEVTTHVDLPTTKALSRALKHYAGAILLITHDRWFSRIVIEGQSARAVSSTGSEDEGSSEEDENGEGGGGRKVGRGKTYKVGGGKVKEVEGMGKYVASVERKLERRRKAAEAAAAAK